MKFILPILHLSTLVFGASLDYSDKYGVVETYEPIFSDYATVEDIVYSICDTLLEQFQVVLEENVEKFGIKYTIGDDGYELAFEDNIKIGINDEFMEFNFLYCFKSSNCTDYNIIQTIFGYDNQLVEIQHEGNFQNLGQSDEIFERFEATTKIYIDDENTLTYESNNNYIVTNGTTESIKAFIKVDSINTLNDMYTTIEGGITECTVAFQDFCPFKSVKLVMDMHLGQTHNEDEDKEGSGEDNEEDLWIWMNKLELYLKFSAKIDGNETPYSPIIIGSQGIVFHKGRNKLLVRIKIPSLIKLNVAIKQYKPEDAEYEDKMIKMYAWAEEKTEFFPFDKNLPLHLLTAGPVDHGAIDSFIEEKYVWNQLIDTLSDYYKGPYGIFRNFMLILVNADDLYEMMKENDSFNISPLIKASGFDSGLLYILGHQNYLWLDSEFNSLSDLNEGMLNNVLCVIAKDLNKDILDGFSHFGNYIRLARKDIEQRLSEELYNKYSR